MILTRFVSPSWHLSLFFRSHDDAVTHVFLSDSIFNRVDQTCLLVSFIPSVFCAFEATKTTWRKLSICPLNSAGYWSPASWFHAWQHPKRNHRRAVQWRRWPTTRTTTKVTGKSDERTIWRSCDISFWHLTLLNVPANENSRHFSNENWFVDLRREETGGMTNVCLSRFANISAPLTIQAQVDSKKSKVSACLLSSFLSGLLKSLFSSQSSISSLVGSIRMHACFFTNPPVFLARLILF